MVHGIPLCQTTCESTIILKFNCKNVLIISRLLYTDEFSIYSQIQCNTNLFYYFLNSVSYTSITFIYFSWWKTNFSSPSSVPKQFCIKKNIGRLLLGLISVSIWEASCTKVQSTSKIYGHPGWEYCLWDNWDVGWCWRVNGREGSTFLSASAGGWHKWEQHPVLRASHSLLYWTVT